MELPAATIIVGCQGLHVSSAPTVAQVLHHWRLGTLMVVSTFTNMLHCHILVQAPWKGTSCCHRLHGRAMILRTWCAISSRHTTQWHDCPGPTAGAGKSATQNATTPCNVEPEGDIHGSVKRFRCRIWRCWMSYEIDHDHAALPYLKKHDVYVYSKPNPQATSRSPCRFSKSRSSEYQFASLSFPSHISPNF